MKLPFGIFEGKYIHISEINSGRTDVLCPYCEIPLIAKKGRIKRHHFAHDGVGCVAHYAGHFLVYQEDYLFAYHYRYLQSRN